MKFYQKIEDLCKNKGISVSRLAKELGLSPSSTITWKNLKSPPRNSTIKLLSDYFNVPYEYFSEEANNTEHYRNSVKIPVFASVAAGIPIEAIEDVIDYEEISEKQAKSGEFFGLRIKGDSMEPRICNNDVVIVRKQSSVNSGDVAIVLINGLDATCKKVNIEPDGFELVSLNPKYPIMFFTPEQVETLPVKIIGKVVELRGKL